tara:strand:- start:1633 stop:2079 length:447 start_codon:yes stop_codon:yes gene_type:complete
MDQGELLRRAQLNALKAELKAAEAASKMQRQNQLNALKEAMAENKPRQQAVKGWAPRASAMNDNIMKATNRMGAMFAKPTTLGEQAAGYLKTALPNFGGKALGFMASPWAASLGGIFAPTQMGNSEFLGSPEHQQWLARKGPLSKDWQ